MEKEVKRMKMEIGITEGRRIVFESETLIVLIGRAYQKLGNMVRRANRRPLYLATLIDWFFCGGSLHESLAVTMLNAGRAVIYGISHWLGYVLLDLKAAAVDYRTRVVIYSEKIHVRLLQLADRVKVSADIFRLASPRHQDRGSGDAVSHNDNFIGGTLKQLLRLRQPAQHIDYHCYRRSSHAGRQYLRSLRRLDEPLLQ